MAQEICVPFRGNIPAYALGALDPDDAAALDVHLQTCEDCRSELTDYRAVVVGLLLSNPVQAPPVRLRQRLQARLPAAQKNPFRLHLAWSINKLAFAVAAILLVALNLYSFFQIQILQREQAELAQQVKAGQAAEALLSYPDSQKLPINAPGLAGIVLLDKDRNVAVLLVWNLPTLKTSQVYQIWLIDPGGKRTSAGVFRPELNQGLTAEMVVSGQNLSSFSGLGVTVEPGVGSIQPTGPRIFRVDF
jgi:anti-sigma-K factor RskA